MSAVLNPAANQTELATMGKAEYSDGKEVKFPAHYRTTQMAYFIAANEPTLNSQPVHEKMLAFWGNISLASALFGAINVTLLLAPLERSEAMEGCLTCLSPMGTLSRFVSLLL
jgi:hypothetical protein